MAAKLSIESTNTVYRDPQVRCLPIPCIIKRTDHVLDNFLSICLRCLLLSHLTPPVQHDETIGDGKNIR